MRTARQEYKESLYEEALDLKCDSFQLKYDGWWSRTEIHAGVGRVFTRTERELDDFLFHSNQPGSFIGEIMYGTNWAQNPARLGKVFLFDVWRLGDTDLEHLPYKTRFQLLKSAQPFLPENYLRVNFYPIRDFRSVWDSQVVNGDFEGVVFRRSTDTVGATLLRLKKEVHDEYICLGYEEGQGKYTGTLGALHFGTKEDPTHKVFVDSGHPATVGGGFTDEQRKHIWNNKEDYLGKWFEVVGKQRFETTGLLRHPNFTRWKE
jgi:hypothetical protein